MSIDDFYRLICEECEKEDIQEKEIDELAIFIKEHLGDSDEFFDLFLSEL